MVEKSGSPVDMEKISHVSWGLSCITGGDRRISEPSTVLNHGVRMFFKPKDPFQPIQPDPRMGIMWGISVKMTWMGRTLLRNDPMTRQLKKKNDK